MHALISEHCRIFLEAKLLSEKLILKENASHLRNDVKMQKMALEGTWICKISWMGCPQTPLEARAFSMFSVRVSVSGAKKILPTNKRTPFKRIHPMGLRCAAPALKETTAVASLDHGRGLESASIATQTVLTCRDGTMIIMMMMMMTIFRVSA